MGHSMIIRIEIVLAKHFHRKYIIIERKSNGQLRDKTDSIY